MENFLRAISPLLTKIRDWLDLIPFLDPLKRILLYLRDRSSQIHVYAPLIVALLIGYLAAELVLWIAKQPLYFLWPVFGWLSGNNISVLSLYNIFAQILAFIVALKIVYEMQPLEVKL